MHLFPVTSPSYKTRTKWCLLKLGIHFELKIQVKFFYESIEKNVDKILMSQACSKLLLAITTEFKATTKKLFLVNEKNTLMEALFLKARVHFKFDKFAQT